MYTANLNCGVQACTAHITRNNSRLKIYGNSIYLKDSQAFEIELFNPTPGKMLAKIEINGRFISDAGIVLNPGQRIYLERFIDSNNKFVFETYDIDKNPEAIAAIKDNGKVNVYFYDEYFGMSSNCTTFNTFTGEYNYFDNVGNTGPGFFDSSIGMTGVGSSCGVTATGSSSVTLDQGVLSTFTSKSIETGRVERGDESNQNFASVQGEFNGYHTNMVSYQILPESKRNIQATDIRNYCTKCGIRVKKASWKFCPGCGTKV